MGRWYVARVLDGAVACWCRGKSLDILSDIFSFTRKLEMFIIQNAKPKILSNKTDHLGISSYGKSLLLSGNVQHGLMQVLVRGKEGAQIITVDEFLCYILELFFSSLTSTMKVGLKKASLRMDQRSFLPG